MRLYLLNLRFSRGGVIAWGVVLLLYTMLLIYIYDSVKEQSQGLLSYIESLPKELRAAFGLGEGDLSRLFPGGALTLEGWMNMEYLSWFPLLLGIYALFYGSGLVAREMERGTLEFLLSRPVARFQVVGAKFLVFLTALGALSTASVVGLLIGSALLGEGINLGRLALAHLQAYLLVAAIGAYSSFFSCLYLNPRKALMASGLLTAGMYFLHFLGPSLDSFKWAQKLSLFYYYQPLPALLGGELHLWGMGLYVLVAIAGIGAGTAIFQRRDIVLG